MTGIIYSLSFALSVQALSRGPREIQSANQVSNGFETRRVLTLGPQNFRYNWMFSAHAPAPTAIGPKLSKIGITTKGLGLGSGIIVYP